MIEPEDVRRALQFLAVIALATIGGLLGYLSRAGESGERVTAWNMALKALSAGFCGCLVYFGSRYVGLGWFETSVLAGLAGWMGAETTIQLLSNQVRKRLGLDQEAKDNDRS